MVVGGGFQVRAVRTVSLQGVSDTCRHQERACISFPWFLIEGGPEDPDSSLRHGASPQPVSWAQTLQQERWGGFLGTMVKLRCSERVLLGIPRA